MRTLRTLKKLILGETWTLPVGIAVVVAAVAAAHFGAAVLLVGVAAVLGLSVERSARGPGRKSSSSDPPRG